MAKASRLDPKRAALAATGTLHHHADLVTDPRFEGSDFFDARDLLQVKYEMLRCVRVDGITITASAAAFGFSRPAFYAAQRALAQGGLAGLLRERPGPRRAHKLSAAVMAFVARTVEDDPAITTPALVKAIAKRFKLTVHRRSVERARQRQGKAP
jgi:transposase